MQEEAPEAPAQIILSVILLPQYCLHCSLVRRGRLACCSRAGVSGAATHKHITLQTSLKTSDTGTLSELWVCPQWLKYVMFPMLKLPRVVWYTESQQVFFMVIFFWHLRFLLQSSEVSQTSGWQPLICTRFTWSQVSGRCIRYLEHNQCPSAL